MLERIVKYLFALIGAFTGTSLVRSFVSSVEFEAMNAMEVSLYVLASIVCGTLFYVLASVMIHGIYDAYRNTEDILQNMTIYEITVTAVGLIIGLVIANLISIPIYRIPIVGMPIAIMLNVFFAMTGMAVAVNKKNENFIESLKKRNVPETVSKVLDTSVIIDGRIEDLVKSGFIEGKLVIPSFVLKELRHISDSKDDLTRNKGRRGLDILRNMQEEKNVAVETPTVLLNNDEEVDAALLRYASSINAQVLTLDYNLNKVASVQGVQVLNINELANALKPVALPGDQMNVKVIKSGKEERQGIGYLEDGTMIVVENGVRFVGRTIDVTVTKVLQTNAGRMIFSKTQIKNESVR